MSIATARKTAARWGERLLPLAALVVPYILTLALLLWLGWILMEPMSPRPAMLLSDFHTAEHLNDELSKRSGTTVTSGDGWWAVEVTQPVISPFGEEVSCRKFVRTLATGGTEVITGDWRFNGDGVRTCRYPKASP
ncbi:hypothetical protein [Mycolicibacterium conceptionense]|uniref:hypothetical protein n=1 Tax=Mycolicibacterium conceptionense TaxID=451644 RepID=UPI00069E5C40|nr:hypothetical protein [Mycolicibacterium conceptionense]